MKCLKRIILASASPRRRELLSMLGIDFEIVKTDADESTDERDPAARVMEIAGRKALAAGDFSDAAVIGADTLVCVDGEFLGKPRTEEEARSMLRKLSGRAHTVYTGVCVVSPSGVLKKADATRVFFRELSEDEINAYVASGEPMDKAGAYGVQGGAAVFIPRIEGDFFNVMGLPLSLLYGMLEESGVISYM